MTHPPSTPEKSIRIVKFKISKFPNQLPRNSCLRLEKLLDLPMWTSGPVVIKP